MGHPWIAAHRPLDWRPAVSDAASQQHVQLPPQQQLVTITQALKKHGSLKEVPTPSYMAATPQNASLTERCFPVLGRLSHFSTAAGHHCTRLSCSAERYCADSLPGF